MPKTLSIQLPESDIKAMVQEQAKHYFEEITVGKTWTLDEFRRNCCFNREKNWIVLYIFSQFENEIDYRKKGGWLRPSKGRGSAYGIFAKPACEWMEQNRDRIDWEAKMP